MKRTLTLSREALAELTADDLAEVVGAGPLPTVPLRECIESRYAPCTV